MSDDWFTKYGGPDFWQEIGEVFYKKVMLVPALSRHFYGIPSSRIKEVVGDMWQVTLGFTGPMSLIAIRERHARLKVSPAEFNQYIFLLRETLIEHEVKYGDIEVIEANLGDVRDLICSETSE